MDLQETLKSLFKSKDDATISKLITSLNREGIYDKEDLAKLTRDQLETLVMTEPEKRKLLDYVKKEFKNPNMDIKIDIEESNRQKEAEIAELRRQREMLRIEGEKKRKELEKLRAENKEKLKRDKANRPKNNFMNNSSDEEDDDFLSYSFNFDQKPRSEEELLKVGIRENGKLIKLKREMYIEDKKRSWMPYRNKYGDDITDEKLIFQKDETSVMSRSYIVLLDVLAFVICWGIFEWIIFSCNIASPYNHTIRVLVASVALFKLFTNCSNKNEFCTNHKIMDGCRDPGFFLSDQDEHFVFRCPWMDLLTGKISKFEVVLNWDFFKSILAYFVFLLTFEILASRMFGIAVQITVGLLVSSFVVAKLALLIYFFSNQSVDPGSSMTNQQSNRIKRSPTRKYEVFSFFEYYKSTVFVAFLWLLVELLIFLNVAPVQVAVVGRVVIVFFIAAKVLGHVYLKSTGRFNCSMSRRKLCED